MHTTYENMFALSLNIDDGCNIYAYQCHIYNLHYKSINVDDSFHNFAYRCHALREVTWYVTL